MHFIEIMFYMTLIKSLVDFLIFHDNETRELTHDYLLRFWFCSFFSKHSPQIFFIVILATKMKVKNVNKSRCGLFFEYKPCDLYSVGDSRQNYFLLSAAIFKKIKKVRRRFPDAVEKNKTHRVPSL